MDCEFFEESYNFSQLNSQRENRIEDLSQLTYPGRIDPKEQVSNNTDTASESIVLPSTLQFTPIPEHLESPEVIDDTSHNVMTNDVTLESKNGELDVETNNE